MSNNLESLENFLSEYNVTLDDTKRHRFLFYYEALVEANKEINLTSLTSFDDVVTKHFIDSLSLVRLLPQIVFPGVSVQMIDVGSGGGFPGIPIKILCPHFDVVLVEPTGKRARFMENLILDLGLEGVAVVQGRAEELAWEPAYRQCFDLCVSRAVANLSTLCEYCLPFVRMGGMFVAYKGGEVEEELDAARRAIHLLGGVVNRVKKFDLPDTGAHRSLVQIDKVAPTPEKYPRRTGVPARRPL